MTSNTENNGFFLDPEEDKEKFKARIIETLKDKYPDADDKTIERKVDEEYERLLGEASIPQHIPTLVEGSITSEIVESESDLDKK